MASTLRTLLTLATVAIVLAGCAGGTTGPRDNDENSLLQGAPLIQTEHPVYTAERREWRLEDGSLFGRYVHLVIRLRYSNSTGGPIYLPTCHGVHPPVLEKKRNGGWVTAYAPVVLDCLEQPQIIERNKTFEYTYQVEGFLPGSGSAPEFLTEVPGTYRLLWEAYETWTPDGPEPGLGRQLPLQDRVSNEFEVRE